MDKDQIMRNTKLLLAAVAAVASTPAFAQSQDMQVTANILNSCTLQVPASVDVSGNPWTNGFNVSRTISVWCTNGYAVNLTTASVNAFRLLGGTTGDLLPYSLAGLPGSFTGNASPTATVIPFDLVFPAQNPRADTYADTVTFTLAP